MTLVPVKWSLADYHQIIATGILAERSVELLNGEIVEMSPEGPEHAYLGDELSRYLEKRLGERAIVRQGRPITLPDDSEPEPDLAIVRSLGQVYRQRHPYPDDIFWLIEVSNTSLDKDINAKRRTYAQAGIQEYWVIDLQHRCLRVFRNPVGADYASDNTLTSGMVHPLLFPDISLSVEHLML
jgi:Uma2 family endonuclease